MKSVLTEIGKAVMDLIETYGIDKDSDYVKKPISHALYYTWKKWDAKEKPKEYTKHDLGRYDPYTDSFVKESEE